MARYSIAGHHGEDRKACSSARTRRALRSTLDNLQALRHLQHIDAGANTLNDQDLLLGDDEDVSHKDLLIGAMDLLGKFQSWAENTGLTE